ncbi:transglycosylase SLT domain-containing protein [Paracraurococcus lichenis]|uniref:Transglycosylase SLT domain-containing protein n=1 Tax=Paracraurococcus lichenis TaxID=3064888 RepID=A0ABT9E9H9_9PROT|nr:transglycosylase SLT domain-containing protein [Paracraurococcus sp. LOR1-02]MDO9712819.1 transglycosylase SLT domain-containing protein [Paracraurococcus sp. LOR1-02]
MSCAAAAAGIALYRCLAADPACLPLQYQPYRLDLASIAEQESGFNPWALRDETTGESLFLISRDALAVEVSRRIADGHALGVGMFQLTGRQTWSRHGLTTLERLTDPCLTMAAGAAHWVADLRAAADQRYNSGRPDGAPGYARQVASRRVRLAPLLEAPSPAPVPEAATPRTRATAFDRAARATAFERGGRLATSSPVPSPEAGSTGVSPQRLTDRTP